MSWLSGHRSGVVRWIIVAVAVVVAGSGRAGFLETVRSSAADAALGAAMDTYTAPLARAGRPGREWSLRDLQRSLQGRQSAVCRGGQAIWLAVRGSQGALLCRRHLRGSGPERLGRDGVEDRGRFVEPQSFKPGQAGAGRPLSPDGPRRTGHRPLQRAGRQALGDRARRDGAA